MSAGDKAAECAFGISLDFEPSVFPVLFEFFGVSGCFYLKSNLSGVWVSVETETRAESR